MPRFFRAISTGQTENLRAVIHDHLMAGERPEDPPPVAEVVRSLFSTLSAFARQPPEAEAPAGQVCAQPESKPPLEEAHPLCEVRRAMELVVQQGQGVEALRLVDPLLAGVFNYILGRPPSSAYPHFEVAGVVAGMCSQSAVCRLEDTLDLTVGLAEFARSPDGKGALGRAEAAAKNPALRPFLEGDGSAYGGENGIAALGKIFIQTILGMEDPAELDKLPIDKLPPEIQPDARASLGDLKKLLDPRREPNVLRPLKKVLSCYQLHDKDEAVIRMVYRLGFQANLPELWPSSWIRVAKGLRDSDSRGTFLYLIRIFAAELRRDGRAVDSAAKVCRTLFSTQVPRGATRSNVERALPVVANLFAQGVAGETLCATDTLVFGCTGGSQPACLAR